MNKEAIINYIKDNGDLIILVVVLIIGTMVFFSLIGLDLNPVVNNNLEKVVTIEKFTGNDACKYNSTNLKKQDEFCKSLNNNNCEKLDCCGVINSNSKYTCRAVDKRGNAIYTDNKENFVTDEMYYNNNIQQRDNYRQPTNLKNRFQEIKEHREDVKRKNLITTVSVVNKNRRNRHRPSGF